MDGRRSQMKKGSKGKKKAQKAEAEQLFAISYTKKVDIKKESTTFIYLSYNGLNRAIVLDIAAVLKQQKNFDIWIDVERTPHGWNFDHMLKSIDRSDIVILFLSDDYKKSDSCRAEATYAKAKKKELLIVKLQHPCEPNGWLAPICADKMHLNFILRYRSFASAADELFRQVKVLSEKLKPARPIEKDMIRSVSLEDLKGPRAKTFDDLVVQAAVGRMELRRFDTLKLVEGLRPFNTRVFDADFVEAIRKADMVQNNGGIYEFCRRLAKTEARAFVLTARAARSAGMTSLAEAIEDAVIELSLQAGEDDIPKAARLVFQMIEGIESLHLHKRKSAIIEQLRRGNRALYTELAEVQNLRKKETVRRLLTTGKRLRRFGKIPVPDNDDSYCMKEKNEDAVRESVRKLVHDGQGLVAIVGEGGLGKSLVVAKLVLDDEFLMKVCNIENVIWLNVYEISSPGLFMDERRFYSQLAEAVGTPVNHAVDMSIERQLERTLSNRDKAVLVVLEDVLSSHILTLTANYEKYLRIIAISPHKSCVQAACNRYDAQMINFEKLPQTRIEAFLGQKLPPTLNRLQITSLAMLCGGLPLVAKMIAFQFSNCRDANEVDSKFRLLVEQHPEKLSLYSPRDMSETDETVCSTVANIFHLTFEREPRELFRRYSAFLWFNVEEMVEVPDIALLWGCNDEEVEPYCEENFCAKSLLQMVDVYEQSTPDAAKRRCYTLHSFLHQVAISFALKKSKSSKRYSLADMTLHAGRTYPERRDGENILHLAVRLHKRAIFTAVVSFIADDAELMLAMCLEKETTNKQTPLDYLYAEDWKDPNEFHLYKDTALGLMFLLYEKMANSKIKPGYGVEVMVKKLRSALDDLLAQILSKVDDKDEPLLLAARENFGALAMALLERGAYPNTRDHEDGNTALTLFARHGNEPLVRMLLRGQQQQTWFGLGLVKAVMAGQEAVVNMLLDRGASPDSVDDNGESAIIKAVRQQDEHILTLLLERGADPNVIERNIHTERFNPSKNVTALMLAVELGNETLVNLLLQHFADINTKNSYGETAQSIAYKRGLKRIADLIQQRIKDKTK